MTVAALEEVRQPLREIMHHRERQVDHRFRPKSSMSPRMRRVFNTIGVRRACRTVDMKAYQQIVEAELKRHFDTDPTLKKIRAGEPVSEADIQALVSLVLTQSPNASRDVLDEFFRSISRTAGFRHPVDRRLRRQGRGGRFAEFARRHPTLTAKQTRFLGLLQNHIARFGSITVDRLYEQPFTVVDADGLDGVFEKEEEIDDLFESSMPSDRLLRDNPNPIIRTKGLNRNDHGRT